MGEFSGRLSRRTVLSLVPIAGLAACGKPGPEPTAGGPTTMPTSTTPTPSPTPTPTPTPTIHVPTRAEIIARFAGRQPKEWSSGEFVPMKGLVRSTATDKVVLTLDACGGPGGSAVDHQILDLLRRERIPAVLFLNKRWIEANRSVFDRLAAEQDLFDIGNHGTRHTPLSVNGRSQYKEPGTKDVGEVYDEVMGNHLFLTELLGKEPGYFRTGTAWYDDVAIDIVRACGEIPIGFDTNGDAGTTYKAATVAKETAKAKPGSIIICHFNQPRNETYEGLAQALPAMKAKGVKFAKLSETGV